MIWKQLKKLNFWQLIKLFRVFALRPHHIILTFDATKKAIKISDRIFPEIHHENGFPNAFRHALWNVLLCQAFYRKNKSLVKTIQRVDQITMLHENLFQNKDLEKAMDIHNNRVGQKLFVKNPDFSEEKFTELLLGKELKAIKISKSTDLKELPETLVHVK